MKRHKEPGWKVAGADQARLRALLDALPDDCAKDDPAFIALLDAWEVAVADARYPDAIINAYRCKGGDWLTDSAKVVIAQIGELAGVPGASGLDAYREHIMTPRDDVPTITRPGPDLEGPR